MNNTKKKSVKIAVYSQTPDGKCLRSEHNHPNTPEHAVDTITAMQLTPSYSYRWEVIVEDGEFGYTYRTSNRYEAILNVRTGSSMTHVTLPIDTIKLYDPSLDEWGQQVASLTCCVVEIVDNWDERFIRPIVKQFTPRWAG